MRILKISDVFFPRVNAVSTSIDTFRRDLEALGHEVVLVAPAYSSSACKPANMRRAGRRSEWRRGCLRFMQA
jgi:1,2-diacylglycerol 3-alpha-glucosyltransferase